MKTILANNLDLQDPRTILHHGSPVDRPYSDLHDDPGISNHPNFRRLSMNDLPVLRPKLSRLKLSGILESLDMRFGEAAQEKWDYTQFLLTLLSDEVERRDNKQLLRRVARSGLDPQKTFATFDFSFNPKLHQPTFKQLATCAFIENKQNLVSRRAKRGRQEPSLRGHRQ